jgi:hypothetical protein
MDSLRSRGRYQLAQACGEEAKYSEESLKPGNLVLFGRVTCEMMASLWPTPMAAENYPGNEQGGKNCFLKRH